MICKNCFYIVNYSQDPDIKKCTMCGEFLSDEPDDILLHGKYKVVKEVRPTQAKLSNHIHELMIRYKNAVLLGEGGTGIGKSFAYLIPAILQDKRVIISTAKKSLQRQLVNKDIPYLLQQMGMHRTYTIFKGVANYACAKQMNRVNNQKFHSWMQEKIRNKIPADLSDWPETEPDWWPDISGENCIDPAHCDHYSRCRPHPKDYQIVIVNHSILAIDLLLSSTGKRGELLGPYDTVIVDEAHQAAEMFKRMLMQKISVNQCTRLYDLLDHSPKTVEAVQAYGDKDVDLMSDLSKLKTLTKQVIKKIGFTTDNYLAVTDFEPIANSLGIMRTLSVDANRTLTIAFRHISKNLKSVTAILGGEETVGEIRYFLNKAVRRSNRIAGTLDRVTSIPEILQQIMDIDVSEMPESNWLLTANKKGLAIQPLELGPILGPRLLEIPYKVLLSATLRYENSFDYIRYVLGIEPLTEAQKLNKYAQKENVYASPFDYAKQSRFYIPAYQDNGDLFPIPATLEDGDNARKEWVKAVAHEIQRMIIGSKGDALVLCHSKADLKEITEDLNLHKLESNGVTIVKQEGDAGFAYEQFLATPKSVLFGLKSFWEGIDIQGSKLRLVIIPKLPFPSPNDPVIVALTKRMGGSKRAFDKLSVPQMIFDIKQGKGRLIRSKTDKGAVAILDARTLTSVKDPSERATILHEMHTSSNPLKRFPKARTYGARVIIEMGIPIRAKTFDELIEFINS